MGQTSASDGDQSRWLTRERVSAQSNRMSDARALGSEDSPTGKGDVLKRTALPVALLIALCLWLAFFVWFGLRAVLFPYALDYGEGIVLDQAMSLARGVSIYQSTDSTPPWTVGLYTPLYPSVLAPLTLVFGPAYWYGRLLSLFGIVLSALLAGSIVRRLTGDRLAAAVTSMLLPMIPSIGLWAPLVRVDALALALSLGGLWCVVRWPGRRLGLVASILLLAAAIYTKQTYALVAPLAAFTWMLGASRRRAMIFASALVAVVVCAGVLLSLVTGGGFWFNVVTANIGAFYWSSVGWHAAFAVVFLPVLVAAGVISVVIAVRARDRAVRLTSCYLLAAVVVSLTVGKVGSGVNCLMELGLALSLASGVVLAWLRTRTWARQVAVAVLAIQALILLGQVDDWYGFSIDRMDNQRVDAQLMQIVRSADGPVLADEELGLLPLLGRPVVLDPSTMTQLVHAGRWDQTALLNAIRGQRYAIILNYLDRPLLRQRWTDEMLTAIERSYVIDQEIARPFGKTLVYRPRHEHPLQQGYGVE